MKSRLLSALLGLVILALGIAVGLRLAERPLPPLGFLGGPRHEGTEVPKPRLTAAQREAFEQGLAAFQPQVEAFQQGFTALDAAFQSRFQALLTEAQRPKFNAKREGIDWVADFNLLAHSRIEDPATDGLPGAQDGPDRSRRLFMAILRIVMYEPSLRIATDKFQLTPDQQQQLRAAMEERRQAFLQLAAQNPLPVDRLYFLLRDLGLLPPPAKAADGSNGSNGSGS